MPIPTYKVLRFGHTVCYYGNLDACERFCQTEWAKLHECTIEKISQSDKKDDMIFGHSLYQFSLCLSY